LVLIRATAERRKELIARVNGFRESSQSWKELLADLKQRGLTKPPKQVVGDGTLGC
jgi:transposase-like protein